MYSTVEEFAQWWVSQGAPIRPPFKNAIYFTEMTASLCLFRAGKYQVELYLVKPDMECPPHSHPGVDSYFVYLTGHLEFGQEDGTFINSDEGQEEGPNGAHMMLGRAIAALNGEKHAVRSHAPGASYLSFEKWNEGSPDSVAVNWVGETVGDLHTSIINEETE